MTTSSVPEGHPMDMDPQKVISRLAQKNAQLTVTCTVQEVAIEDLRARVAQLEADAEMRVKE